MILAIAAYAATGCSIMKKNTANKETMPEPTEQTAKVEKPKGGLTADMISGEWTIVKVKDQDVPQEDKMPYVNFEPSTGRFYASNGCNTINGGFSLEAGNILRLAQVATTMMLCHDIPFEQEITALLSGQAKLQVKLNRTGHESYLTLTDTVSGLSLQARRHNMEFLNGQWRIAQINGRSINDEEANIFIDLGEMKVHGNTGCNYFNGEIYIDPSKTNSVEFGKMGLTRMACPKFEQEQSMMLGLEETTNAIQGDNGRVMLLKADGTPVIVLEKQAVK